MRRLLSLALSLALLAGCAPARPAADPPAAASQPPAQSQPEPVRPPEPDPEPEPEPEPVVSHLMVAGDIMSHMPLTNDCYVAETGSYDYTHVLREPAEQLTLADFAVGNLETTLAGGPEYSGYPRFNSPDELAANIREAGFDLLCTTNNHCLDKGFAGVRLRCRRGGHLGGLPGLHLRPERTPPARRQALRRQRLQHRLLHQRIQSRLRPAGRGHGRRPGPGHRPDRRHPPLGRRVPHQAERASGGAGPVPGGAGGRPGAGGAPPRAGAQRYHHGQEHQGFVIYSLGNFISNQNFEDRNKDLATKTTVILDLELTKDPDGNTSLTDVRYTPYYMVHRNNKPVGERRHLVNVNQTFAP